MKMMMKMMNKEADQQEFFWPVWNDARQAEVLHQNSMCAT